MPKTDHSLARSTVANPLVTNLGSKHCFSGIDVHCSQISPTDMTQACHYQSPLIAEMCSKREECLLLEAV